MELSNKTRLPIITRNDAKVRGLKRYFTGAPCLHGHLVERLVSNGRCYGCSKAALKKWEARNRHKSQARGKAWYAANRERARARDRVYVAAHRAEANARSAKWRLANPDKWVAVKKRTRQKHRAKTLEYTRRYRLTHMAEGNAQTAKRRAAKLRATPAWADLVAISALYDKATREQERVGIETHVDHIVPLVSKLVCGLHCEANLQLLTQAENSSKHNKHWPDMP